MTVPTICRTKVAFAVAARNGRILMAGAAMALGGMLCLAQNTSLRIVQTASPRVLDTPECRLQITLSFQVQDAQGKVVQQLPPGECIIYEDGKEVHRFRPQTLPQEQREVMLVLDTSGSMIGTPERPLDRLEKAKEAATNFLMQLGSDTECGLVLFHHQPYQTLPPEKNNRPRLIEAIQSAKGAGGTAYLDAAIEAMNQFSNQSKRQRAIVLLTDGRDVNSQHKLADVIETARQRHVSIHTIGLGKPGANLHIRSLLILDRSGSMKESNKIGYLRQAASRFVELMPADHADCSLLPFNDRFVEPERSTAEKSRLLSRIQKLTPEGGTALYDVTLSGLEWIAQPKWATVQYSDGSERPCRRVVILLTDGMNEGGRVTSASQFYKRLADLHKRAQIPVFVIGLGDPRKKEIDEHVLRRIAEITGGRYYGVSNPAHLQDVFERLSIDIHDEGIDESALRALAEQTGGRYFHAEQSGELAREFHQALQQIEATLTVTYLSPRRRQDGTPSRIEIRLGDIRGETAYATHWVITPTVNLGVFFTLLAGLATLGALPVLLRRRQTSATASP